jgi:hypothetical protein
METCHGGKIHTSTIVDGRKVPLSMYYVGRGKDGHVQTSAKPHNAALMTEPTRFVTSSAACGFRGQQASDLGVCPNLLKWCGEIKCLMNARGHPGPWFYCSGRMSNTIISV